MPYRTILRIALIATILAAPLYLIRSTTLRISITDISLLATSLLHGIILWNKQLRYDRAVLYGGGAILIGALCSGITRDTIGAYISWLLLPWTFAITLSAALHARIITRALIARALIVGSAWIALAAIAIMIHGSGTTFDGRLRAFYPSPNHLALALAPMLPLTISALFAAQTPRNRRFLILTATCIASALFFSKSLGGIIAAMGGTAFVIVRHKHIPRITLALVPTVLAAILLLWWPTPRIQDFFTTHSSLTSRMAIWRSAVQIAADHPLLGIGIDRFQSLYLAYQAFFPPYPEWAVPQPHNLLLATWMQSGIVGLIGLLYVVYAAIQRAACSRNAYTVGAMGALIAIILHGIVDTPLWKNDLAIITWTILVLLLTTPYRCIKSDRL